jgi:hypothetical protein
MPSLNKINRAVSREIAEQFGERAGYRVDEWCHRYGVSRALLYLMWKRGEGPAYIQLPGMRIIPKEADDTWRQQLTRRPEAAA